VDIHEESRLVEAIQSGDQAAASTFCDRFTSRVALMIRGRRIPTADCDALVQDILATALHQLGRGQFKGDARLGTWLHRIVLGKIADYWRASRTAKQLVPLESVPTESLWGTFDFRPEDGLAVQEALHRLSLEDRLVLWLRDAEGATLEEIGRRIGRKKSAVAERVARARELFRIEFGGSGGKSSTKPRLKG
jgi:RNA polymerase sigma-70 factor (ECF subfamily)